MSRTGSVLWRAFLFGGLAAVAVYFVVPHGLVQNTLYNALSLAAAVALVAGARLHRPDRRLPWYLLAAGQLLFTIGDQAWDFFGSSGIPTPSRRWPTCSSWRAIPSWGWAC